MKKYAIGLILIVTILVSAGISHTFGRGEKTEALREIPAANKSLDKNILWGLVQEWRVSQGLPQYVEDQRLCEVAKDRVDDEMLDHNDLYTKYKNYPYVIQENLVKADGDKDALSLWTNSPPHRKTLSANYKYSCIEVEDDYAVQIFSNL